jgi:tetratricopeptide (TPR) repeat protein
MPAGALHTGRASARPVRASATPPRPAPPAAAPPRPLHERLALGLAGAAAALVLAAAPPAGAEGQPFLKRTGARGLLAAEEETLFRLREAKEAEVRAELGALRDEAEEEARRSFLEANAQRPTLCATPFGVDVVGISEFVALTGALVGGVAARRRKDEVEKLNEQLRTINTQLRQQARAGTIYAPGLTYAPPGGADAPAAAAAGEELFGGGAAARLQAAVTAAAPPAAPPAAPAAPAAPPAEAPAAPAADEGPPPPMTSVLMSLDDDERARPEVAECQAALREGKRLLKAREGGAAMVRFEKALLLARGGADRVRERRATRGLAAAARMVGQGRAAIRHLERVLEISAELGDSVGDADAYGTIADVYTDLGEFEKAGEFYDRYIDRMAKDGPV